VWYAGIGIGFPLAALITAWFQYDKLTKVGKTTYDRDAALAVHHRIIGAERLVLVALVIAGFIALIALGEAQQATVLSTHDG
jgi:hypothetical protein